MNLFRQFLTALRGVASETKEITLDGQSIQMMEEEMRTANQHLNEAKAHLTEAIVEQMSIQRQVKQLIENIKEYEDYTLQALERSDEVLALECAEKMANLKNNKVDLETVLETYTVNVDTLKNAITVTEKNITAMERDLAIIKTTESIQNAHLALSETSFSSNPALYEAMESLERIKAQQQQRADKIEAALELHREESNETLQIKLQQAGLVDSAHSGQNILDELKVKHTQS